MTDVHAGGITFRQRPGPPSERGVSDDAGFVLVKTDDLLDFYLKLRSAKPKTVLEVGMYEGGSLVWFDQIYQPDVLVGIDARKEPIEALERYRATRPHIKTFYRHFQETPETLSLAKECFPGGIDLIIDDASHLYDQTKATFDMLFPLVNPGGHYVIEDWSWSHGLGRQAPDSTWYDRPALTNLVLEIVMRAGHSAAIESVHIQQGVASVVRGKGSWNSMLESSDERLRGRSISLL